MQATWTNSDEDLASIEVEGFGVVEFEIPKEFELDNDIFMDAVAKIVAQTCQLMKPNAKGEFHPVLGFADGS